MWLSWYYEEKREKEKFRVQFSICPFFSGFLRKVYGILSAQLLFTTLVGLLCVTVEPVKVFIQGRSVKFVFVLLHLLILAVKVKSWLPQMARIHANYYMCNLNVSIYVTS